MRVYRPLVPTARLGVERCLADKRMPHICECGAECACVLGALDPGSCTHCQQVTGRQSCERRRNYMFGDGLYV